MFEKKKNAPAGAGDTDKSKIPNNSTTDNISENPTEDKTEKRPDAKSREWWAVGYPESLPENWREQVQEYFLETYISPLHDRDLNPDGTPKKPHYHVVLVWPGPTTYSRALEVFKSCGLVMQHKVIGSLRGVCRYLCHLDNPEKAQYSVDDVESYNGGDYQAMINLPTEKYGFIREMQEWCDKYHIYSYGQLMRYAKERRSDWYRALCDSCAYIMQSYCKSLQWEIEHFGSISSVDDILALMDSVDSGRLDLTTGEVKEGNIPCTAPDE